METRLRLLLVLAGLPPPAVQHPVIGPNARVLAWLDLAYPQVRLGIEYDGDVHLDPLRAVRDKRRDGALGEQGWLVLHFTKSDVLARPDRTVLRVRRVLADRS
jgi:very-short-patch-repair endonuclease